MYLFSSILLAYSVTQDGCWLRQINSSFFSSFSVEIHLPPITRQKDIHATRDGVAGRAREERPLGTSWRLCCRVALILKFPDRVTVDPCHPVLCCLVLQHAATCAIAMMCSAPQNSLLYSFFFLKISSLFIRSLFSHISTCTSTR